MIPLLFEEGLRGGGSVSVVPPSMNSGGNHEGRHTHEHARQGVRRVMVATVDGGYRNAQSHDAKQNAKAGPVGAHSQRRGGDRCRVGARKDARLHAQVVQNPKVQVSQQGRNKRSWNIVKQDAWWGKWEGRINCIAEKGSEEDGGPKLVKHHAARFLAVPRTRDTSG